MRVGIWTVSRGAAQRMQTLIDGLLAYSRTSAHPPAMVAVDLNELVQGVLSDLEMRVTESGAWVIRGPLPTVEADPVQMRQLFQNLLGNALKFRRPDVPAQVRLSRHGTRRRRPYHSLRQRHRV